MFDTIIREYRWRAGGADLFRIYRIAGPPGSTPVVRRVTMFVYGGEPSLPTIAIARDTESLEPDATGTVMRSRDNCDFLDSQGDPAGVDPLGPLGRSVRTLTLYNDDRIYATNVLAATAEIRMRVTIQEVPC